MARIALVCEPPDGGVAEHVAQLALKLPEHGHDATVLAPAGFAPAERLASAGVHVRTLDVRRSYREPWTDARALAHLVHELRTGRFALVHAHSAKAGVLARLAAASTRTPSVYTPHCFPFVGEVNTARRLLGLTVERTLARVTSAVVCVCRAERDLAVSHRIDPRGSLVIVYNGCPACADGSAQPELVALRARGPIVGAVTVLRRQKRLDLLVACAPRLLRAVPEAQIAIVGGGPEESRLRAQATRLGVPIAFMPFREPSAHALRALDVYVLPSGWEAFPIGLIEAQACGVPQVVTDVGGNSEAVTPLTGLVVPPRDPVALADALIALLRDPERRTAMAAASRLRHAERFSLEQMVAGTAAVYAAVLGGSISTRRGRRSPPAESPAVF
jgi:glycosyltransferase involved in cell wall biosynthesis